MIRKEKLQVHLDKRERKILQLLKSEKTYRINLKYLFTYESNIVDTFRCSFVSKRITNDNVDKNPDRKKKASTERVALRIITYILLS